MTTRTRKLYSPLIPQYTTPLVPSWQIPLVQLARQAGLPVKMATMSDLVRVNDEMKSSGVGGMDDNHHLHDYVIRDGAQTSEKEAADMLINYIKKCLDERVILDDGSRR